jgi:uncharacterized protein (UPF0335 family)
MAKRSNDDDEDLVGGTDGLKGHNSGGAAGAQLRAFVERIERLEEDKKAIADDIKDVYAEAKGTGFDTKALRKIVAERKQDQAERLEFETILDLYRHALGMALSDDDD